MRLTTITQAFNEHIEVPAHARGAQMLEIFMLEQELCVRGGIAVKPVNVLPVQLVLQGPVWSGLLSQKGRTKDQDQDQDRTT